MPKIFFLLSLSLSAHASRTDLFLTRKYSLLTASSSSSSSTWLIIKRRVWSNGWHMSFGGHKVKERRLIFNFLLFPCKIVITTNSINFFQGTWSTQKGRGTKGLDLLMLFHLREPVHPNLCLNIIRKCTQERINGRPSMNSFRLSAAPSPCRPSRITSAPMSQWTRASQPPKCSTYTQCSSQILLLAVHRKSL